MSAALAFEAAERAGVSIAVQYGRIHLRAETAPPATVLELIKAHRAEILAILTAETDAKLPRRTQNTDANDDHVGQWVAWNERAAIMEFDGGVGRREAEREAAKAVTGGGL